MKRYLLSLASLMLFILPTMANPHGKDYSLNDGGGSSGFLMIIVLAAFVLYGLFSAKSNKKK